MPIALLFWLFFSGLSASTVAFVPGSFYRYVIGGSSGVIVTMEVTGSENQLTFSLVLPEAIRKKVNPNAVGGFTQTCSDLQLQWSPQAGSSSVFSTKVNFDEDPCLKAIQTAMLMPDGSKVIEDTEELIYDAVANTFKIKIVIDAVLSPCDPDEPIVDSDDESDEDESDEIAADATAEEEKTADVVATTTVQTEEAGPTPVLVQAEPITEELVTRLANELAAALRQAEDLSGF